MSRNTYEASLAREVLEVYYRFRNPIDGSCVRRISVTLRAFPPGESSIITVVVVRHELRHLPWFPQS